MLKVIDAGYYVSPPQIVYKYPLYQHLVAFYIYADYSLLYRVIALVVGAGLSIAIALQTAKGREIWGYFHDAQIEVRKVVWPTKQETTQTALGVIVIVVPPVDGLRKLLSKIKFVQGVYSPNLNIYHDTFEHISFFNSRSIELLANRLGLKMFDSPFHHHPFHHHLHRVSSRQIYTTSHYP